MKTKVYLLCNTKVNKNLYTIQCYIKQIFLYKTFSDEWPLNALTFEKAYYVDII